MIKILKCNCKSTWQDNKFGENNRAMNSLLKEHQFRCTVCDKVRDDSNEVKVFEVVKKKNKFKKGKKQK